MVTGLIVFFILNGLLGWFFFGIGLQQVMPADDPYRIVAVVASVAIIGIINYCIWKIGRERGARGFATFAKAFF